jgi:uroporphyrinogen III methyltransferase / synthase
VTVYLVGAGPGDPGLLTVRALELIAAADVIVYDRLIPDAALAGARPDAELVYAGKEGGGPSVAQSETERLLLEHGLAGRAVVRLKGGDPFVFGRGGEEAEVLQAAGIAFEVVPGVTAGVAAPAYAGIPVTHRDGASAVAFVTGHEDPTKPDSALDWGALAAFPGTLVIYMGVRQLEAITERLMAAGRSGAEPAAVIERGTFPDQRVLTGTIATIAAVAVAGALRAPAIAVLGPVAALHDRLDWSTTRSALALGSGSGSGSGLAPDSGSGAGWGSETGSGPDGPLAGATVVVTRARAQASALASRLRGLGARVVEAPVIKIQELEGPAPAVESYDLVCLTSPNGVRLLFARLAAAGRDARALAGVTVAAIGPGTAAALEQHGVIADVVPERFIAEGLVEALADVPVTRALVARAAQARDVLPAALRERGAEVDVLALYETVTEPLTESQLVEVGDADYVTFTSASTVRFFYPAARERLSDRTRLVSIGPITSAALREHGLEPDVEADRHDIDGLIEALVSDAVRAPTGS